MARQALQRVQSAARARNTQASIECVSELARRDFAWRARLRGASELQHGAHEARDSDADGGDVVRALVLEHNQLVQLLRGKPVWRHDVVALRRLSGAVVASEQPIPAHVMAVDERVAAAQSGKIEQARSVTGGRQRRRGKARAQPRARRHSGERGCWRPRDVAA